MYELGTLDPFIGIIETKDMNLLRCGDDVKKYDKKNSTNTIEMNDDSSSDLLTNTSTISNKNDFLSVSSLESSVFSFF